MYKVKCVCQHDMQLRMLGGAVYLRPGEETVLTETQMSHSSIKYFLKEGSLEVIPEPVVETVVPETEVETEPPKPVSKRRERASAPTAE